MGNVGERVWMAEGMQTNRGDGTKASLWREGCSLLCQRGTSNPWKFSLQIHDAPMRYALITLSVEREMNHPVDKTNDGCKIVCFRPERGDEEKKKLDMPSAADLSSQTFWQVLCGLETDSRTD